MGGEDTIVYSGGEPIRGAWASCGDVKRARREGTRIRLPRKKRVVHSRGRKKMVYDLFAFWQFWKKAKRAECISRRKAKGELISEREGGQVISYQRQKQSKLGVKVCA